MRGGVRKAKPPVFSLETATSAMQPDTSFKHREACDIRLQSRVTVSAESRTTDGHEQPARPRSDRDRRTRTAVRTDPPAPQPCVRAAAGEPVPGRRPTRATPRGSVRGSTPNGQIGIRPRASGAGARRARPRGEAVAHPRGVRGSRKIAVPTPTAVAPPTGGRASAPSRPRRARRRRPRPRRAPSTARSADGRRAGPDTPPAAAQQRARRAAFDDGARHRVAERPARRPRRLGRAGHVGQEADGRRELHQERSVRARPAGGRRRPRSRAGRSRSTCSPLSTFGQRQVELERRHRRLAVELARPART